MAIAFVAAGTLVDNATATSITITKPAGLATGHLVIVALQQVTATSIVISPPDNTWYEAPAQDTQSGGSGIRVTTYYHVATGSEPTWLFTFNASTRVVGVSIAYSGVASLDVVGLASGTSTPAVAPQSTVFYGGDTVVCIVANNNSAGASGVTLDGALTSRFSDTTADTHFRIAIGDGTGPAAGLLTTAYSNTVTTQNWIVPIIALSETGTVAASVSNIGVIPTSTYTSGGISSTTVAATVPTSIQNGDLLVAFLRIIPVFGGSFTPWTITPPAGWTKIREDATTVSAGLGVQAGYYTHTVTTVGSEPSTYTWTLNTATNVDQFDIIMVPVRGVTGIDAGTFNSANTAVSTLTIAGVTAANDNEPTLICGNWGSDSGSHTLDCVGLQAVVSTTVGHQVWSALSGIAASTYPTQTVTLTGTASNCILYEVAFVPAVANTPKIVGSTVVNRYSAVSSVDITIPSGTAAGDVLIAHVTCATGKVITPPSGWAAITNALADDTNFLAQAFQHTVAGGDPSPVTFSFSGSSTGFASILATRNVLTSSTIASNSTTQGLTPNLTGMGASSMVLMYETIANNALSNGNPLGLQQATFLTPFVYNPNSRNGGNISRGGALSVFLQTGVAGGVSGKNYRVAGGSTTGPQMTIALAGAAPTPPPTPPPPIPPGPPVSQALPFHGQIDRLPQIPPVNSFHEVDLVLKQKFLEVATLQKQIVKYAANPQQHYKAVQQAAQSVQQYDTQQAAASQENIPPYQSTDSGQQYPSTGFVTTLGAGVTVTTVSVPDATPTVVNSADPSFVMNEGDLIMAVVTGTWDTAMYNGIMDITYAGQASGAIYFAKRINIDSAGRFSDTQIFTAPSGVAGDTTVQFGTSQSTGGAVNIITCTLYIGNYQLR